MDIYCSFARRICAGNPLELSLFIDRVRRGYYKLVICSNYKMSEEDSASTERVLGTENETTEKVNEEQKLEAGKMLLKLKWEKRL